METEKRVSGKKIPIGKEEIHAFFENRTKKELPHRYNYVIYQDANPKLAIERDQHEKSLIQKYLRLDKNNRVLDIGCGVGRWADEVVKLFFEDAKGEYVGVDFSEKLLDVAREHFEGNAKCQFLCGSFQNLKTVLEENNCTNGYDQVLVNGVLMYINDNEVGVCLDNVDTYLRHGGIVYIKEPVGVNERFTLNQFYSEELTSEYSAIYRSLAEYTALFTEAFFKKDYTLVACSPTWPEDLENRKETMNYYWILRK